LSQKPAKDLFAGPEQDLAMVTDMGERGAKIPEPMRGAPDARVHEKCHDPRGLARTA
jgi:hypothetical protein